MWVGRGGRRWSVSLTVVVVVQVGRNCAIGKCGKWTLLTGVSAMVWAEPLGSRNDT